MAKGRVVRDNVVAFAPVKIPENCTKSFDATLLLPHGEADVGSISVVNVSAIKGKTIGTLDFDYGSGTVTYNPMGRFHNLHIGQTTTDVFAFTMFKSDGEVIDVDVTITIEGVAP